MQKFEEWYASYNPYLDLELDDCADELRSAYEAGYKQRDKEINEHYRKVMADPAEQDDESVSRAYSNRGEASNLESFRKVMKDEESNEVGIPMSPVGDLDYSC